MAWVLWMVWVSGSAMASLVWRWSGFDGGFCASWSCFFSLSIKLRWWVWWCSRVLAQYSWSENQAQICWIFYSGCGWSWLASCCWVVVGGCSLAMVVDCAVCGAFFGSSMYYFIEVDILFYCTRYIILLWYLYYFIVLKTKIDSLLQHMCR